MGGRHIEIAVEVSGHPLQTEMMPGELRFVPSELEGLETFTIEVDNAVGRGDPQSAIARFDDLLHVHAGQSVFFCKLLKLVSVVKVQTILRAKPQESLLVLENRGYSGCSQRCIAQLLQKDVVGIVGDGTLRPSNGRGGQYKKQRPPVTLKMSQVRISHLSEKNNPGPGTVLGPGLMVEPIIGR